MTHHALAATLASMGYPEPVCELPVPGTTRKWRIDLAWPDRTPPLAIEIQGGIWSRGRHTRGKGYESDCQKLNHLQLEGWVCLWIPTDWWTSGEVWPLLDRALRRDA